jgi:molybdopterin synthase catalytic subunit
MRVRVLAFARLRELLGFGEREFDLGGHASLDALRAQRGRQRRRDRARRGRRDRTLAAGGRRVIALQAQPIDVAALIAAVAAPEHGGLCTFVGTTRTTSPGDARPVRALEYEAYPGMAVRDMEAIADETRARFGPLAIAIVHRTGRVAVGEASVAIAVGAPHRDAAFGACRYAIDTLKARTPIWKREEYADGDAAWVANTP